MSAPHEANLLHFRQFPFSVSGEEKPEAEDRLPSVSKGGSFMSKMSESFGSHSSSTLGTLSSTGAVGEESRALSTGSDALSPPAPERCLPEVLQFEIKCLETAQALGTCGFYNKPAGGEEDGLLPDLPKSIRHDFACATTSEQPG